MTKGSKGFFKSKHGGLRKVPDFIYWNALFVLLTAIHYSTKTQGTPYKEMVDFFVLIWICSFMGLLAVRTYSESRKKEVMDFDENLERWHVNHIFIGLMAVEAVALIASMMAVKAQEVFSAMWVPTFQIGVGGFEFYDDILFNIGLVATAEELSKVISIRLLYMKLGDSPGGRAFSVMGPVAFWSMLHGYKAYVGLGEAAMWVMIAGAFGAGLVMYWVWKETENILAAIWVHGFHNSIVILSPVLREAQVPSLSADFIFYIVTVIVVVGGVLALRSRRNRKKLASILT